MANRRNDHRAMRGTLLGVLIALAWSPAMLMAQSLGSPESGVQQSRAEAMPLIEVPAPKLLAPPQVAPAFLPTPTLGFEPAPTPRVIYSPIYEYQPIAEPQPPSGIEWAEGRVDPDAREPVVPTAGTSDAAKPVVFRTVTPACCDQVEMCERRGLWKRCLSCVPWVAPLECCCDETPVTCQRFVGGLYECLCCPDPCYVPRWQPLADSAFDVAAVRPRTQQRLRWDAGMNLNLPDRSEFFWARADGNGRGPAPTNGALLASNQIRYNDFTYTFEAAIEKFALIVQVPYRSITPTDYPYANGLGDIKFGAKSVFFDCELLQIGGQFLVYAPSADASKGLGTGHYSLEPSLLLGLRVGPNSYLQSQISEWIPVHGDQQYAGGVLHTHTALNHELCRLHEDWPLLGTFGINTWTFQDGAYTDPLLGSNQRSGGYTYTTAGYGLRLFICDRIDFGVAAQFALYRPHFADQIYTTEFRWRF